MKNTLTLVMILLIAGTPLLVAAAPSGERRGSPRVRKAAMEDRHRKAIQRLNLTQDQKTKIRDYRAGYRQRVTEIQAKILVKRTEIQNEMDKTTPDQARIKQLTDEIGQLKAARDLERLKAKRELEKLLTPEQNAELKRINQEQGNEAAQEGVEDAPEE